MIGGVDSLVGLLMRRAAEQPEQIAYSFWGEDTRIELTYGELDLRARAIGAWLQAKGATGERALLLYPTGIEYVTAFFGCLYGGVVAVPAYPPRQNGNLGRLQAVVADAEAKFALTTETILAGIEKRFAESPEMEALRWLVADATDRSLAELWLEPDVGMESLAFLQYTSGSTSTPKGVMLTHGNLLHNLEMIEEAFGTTAESRGVVWLPPYHDMGLIGGILQPLFTGYPMMLMAPVDFIQKPLRWLQAISETKATVSGGPNFAYELCLQKITPEQRDGLDLSSWENAFTGAEPVRAETLKRFAEFFAPCGFKEEAFYPCYGLAEATLFVSGGTVGHTPQIERIEADALAQNRAVATTAEADSRLMVSSGRGDRKGQQLLIVDAASKTACADGQVGEVWVKGPNIAIGYWNREQQTEETFCAALADSGDGPFLRTGDLGFRKEGQIYLTGRIKDLLIIRGRNYYPQDVEFVVQESHPAVKNSNGAAFAVEIGGEERLVVVQEIERTHRKGDHQAVIAAVRKRVSEEFQLQVHAVVLIKPASIPKTSSGKIQRHACKERFLNGTLEVVADDAMAQAAMGAGAAVEASERIELNLGELLALPTNEREAPIANFLLGECAEILKVTPGQLPIDRSLHAYGMDSLMAVEIKHLVEVTFAVDLTMSDVLDGPSVAELSRLISEQLNASADRSPLEAVEPEERAESLLSFGQKSLYFMQSVAPESAAYNISKTVRIAQRLDVQKLKAAFAELLTRHPQLRVTVEMQDDQPIQKVVPQAEASVVVKDASLLSADQLRAELIAEANRPFDFTTGQLLRVHLWQISETEHLLQVTAHHIAVDFWSFGLLLQELGAHYSENGKAEVDHSYFDYVRWQQELLRGEEGDRLWSYWQERLEQVPVLDLPTDRTRPAVQHSAGAVQAFELPEQITQQMHALAKELGVTLYTVMLTAFQVLLYRYSGQADFVIGSPSAGRSSAKFSQTVGYFVNPVVLRSQIVQKAPFVEVVERVRADVLTALKHQDFPFQLLVERLQPDRDLSSPPLFNVMFNYQSAALWKEEGLIALALGAAGAKIAAGELMLESIALPQQFAQYDLSLMMGEMGGKLHGVFEYSTSLFDRTTIERMIGHFQTLLTSIAEAPASSVDALPLLTANEQELLLGWQGEVGAVTADRLHRLLEQQVALTPEAVAVSLEGQMLTYDRLNRLSNRVAHQLRELGVGADVPVGICMERSLELVVGLLAILKAGGAYVPLDPSYPEERIAWIAEDTAVPVVLTQEALLAKIPIQAATAICLDRDEERIATYPEHNLDVEVSPDHLAYILYTSGSTGRPKGVEIPHRAIVNHMLWMQEAYPLGAGDRVLQKTPIGFDASVWEFWAPLLSGAQLVLARPGGHRDSGYLVSAVKAQQITVLQLVPTMLGLMLEEPEIASCQSLKHVFCGGEALSIDLQERFFQVLDAKLHNLYGPTECTIDATVWDCQKGETKRSVPIGRPIANLQTFVLDGQMRPVPALVAGELHIGGLGLARGYHNRADLTAEKFVFHPTAHGERLYKTGDLVRFLADGTLEYLGRLDHQVKIRGFRIELGEIEAVLKEHPDHREAVVIAREDVSGDVRLVAYLIGPSTAVSDADLRNLLKQKLPDYMIPSAFVLLDSFPLLPNGKIDLRALPQPTVEAIDATVPYTAPRTPTEAKLASMWSEVLGIERVGVYDHFFQRGGHSLLAMQIVTRVRKLFQVEVPVARLFENPTIAELAKIVDESIGRESKPKKPAIGRLSREAHRIDG
ncbi:amino acid adenylation domain-containing protein [Tumebacillus lipolyticus]|uniref:Amino acid adenylation domain-containing protein n=1 Tax=Tumebacillus lipolyticus TaxID=1280370 RepID=A0ABW4ZSR5_9BACL